jgi:uncharacterized protein
MKRTRGWAAHVQATGAVLLVFGYLQDVFITLQAMSVHRDNKGLWNLSFDPSAVSKWWSVVLFLLVVLGISAFFGGYLFKQFRARPTHEPRSRLTLRDMLLSFGWVGVLLFGGVFAFYSMALDLVPQWFRESPAASALGGVSMQIAAIVAIPLYYRKSLPEIGLRRPVISKRMIGYVLMFFVFMYASSILTNMVGSWMGINTDSYREQSISQELHGALKGGWWLALLPMIATSIIAPVGEELLFRGVLQSTLTAKYGKWIGLFGSAFLFALIHADPVLFLPIFLIGLLFAALYRITGSIWAPIWLHVLNNLYASLMDLL